MWRDEKQRKIIEEADELRERGNMCKRSGLQVDS